MQNSPKKIETTLAVLDNMDGAIWATSGDREVYVDVADYAENYADYQPIDEKLHRELMQAYEEGTGTVLLTA